ncbi:PqqD family protein [Sphingomonas sp. NSE70-1]|uniref:PqqD family protein n=1 Tax=Sphingomonas caseinilyticus TaxID=2908205 RepID=A0ABT0RQT6_9SPHN|nr:PqqD family protein [Sphingomonas caseinilyticus]MCL6697383.1 PqqD family protein [Sphingomonas caseinilyticus]
MTTVVKRSGTFTETEIDDEIVVMHLGTGEFYSLAGTAATIWRLIDGTRSRSDLAIELSGHFASQGADIGFDVDAFLGQLAAVGLVDVD